jgi:hypothetical protein
VKNLDLWWHARKGTAAQPLLDHVQRIEQDQSDTYERFVKLAALYDPNSPWGASSNRQDRAEQLEIVTENVIATNVDTVASQIAAQDLRFRFPTDGAEWSMQRLAKHLEWYAEELNKTFDTHEKCLEAFWHGTLVKGTGVVFAFVDHLDRIICQVVPPDDVVVDERECRGGRTPKQLHWRRIREREELAAEFPQFEDKIYEAHGGGGIRWAGYRPISPDELVCLYSWRLPAGKKGSKGYVPGRFVIAIDGVDLHDEKYEEDCFPCERIVWTPRQEGWYGIGLAERIAGHQRTLNRSNLQLERMLDQNAFITTYVRPGDAGIAAKQINKLGTIAVYKDEIPKTIAPPAVHPEQYKRHQDVKVSAREESGVSSMASAATKPAGLDSGRALREYRDGTTVRFASQEKAFEKFRRGVTVLLLMCCKKLGKKAPAMTKSSKFGSVEIPWSKVEEAFLKTKIAAASTLNRTPAGREQTLIEWAQAGVISTDDFRRMIGHPDLERAMSLYTAAMEDVDECLEAIADGNIVMPEPFMNLRMCVWRGQNQYLLWNRSNRSDKSGAPEEILEAVRQFVVQAAEMLAREEEQQAMAAPGAVGAMPGATPAGPPQAALAAQAMDTMAG